MGSDSWSGFGYFVFGTVLIIFLPFLAALFGRDLRLKGAALGLCLATLFLTGQGLPEILCWLGAWVFAILAIRARFKARAEPLNP